MKRIKRLLTVAAATALLAALFCVTALGARNCLVHSYTGAGGNICTCCGYEYIPQFISRQETLTVTARVAVVRDAPYAQTGALLGRLYQGDSVTVTHFVCNAYGGIWYLTESGGYINSRDAGGAPRLCQEHTYDVGQGSRCTVCGWSYQLDPQPCSQVMYAADHGVPVQNSPYVGVGGVVFRLDRYERVEIAGTVINATGHLWYVTADGHYIRARHLALYTGPDVGQVNPGTQPPVTPRDAVDEEVRADLNEVEGIAQVEGDDGIGLCTSCATGLMIRRRQVVDGQEGSYQLYDVRMTFGLSRQGAEELRSVNPNWLREGGFTDRYSGDGSGVWYTDGYRVEALGRSVEDRKAAVIALLEEHPEGIVIYCDTEHNIHAIVLTGYDPEEDTFYACDSVDVRDAPDHRGRCAEPLADTYLCVETGGTQDDVFARMVTGGECVWFVSSTGGDEVLP